MSKPTALTELALYGFFGGYAEAANLPIDVVYRKIEK